MANKSYLTILFGIISLGLVACDGSDRIKADTGVPECDQYLKALNRLGEKLSDDQRAAYEVGVEEIIQLAKKRPNEAVDQCKIALDSIPAEYH